MSISCEHREKLNRSKTGFYRSAHCHRKLNGNGIYVLENKIFTTNNDECTYDAI